MGAGAGACPSEYLPPTAGAPCPSTVRAVVIFVVIFGRVICHGVFRVYFRAEYGGRIRRQAVDVRKPLETRKTPFLLGFWGGCGRWIRTTEGASQQIYSLPSLTA